MKKRIITLALVLAMALSYSVIAMADYDQLAEFEKVVEEVSAEFDIEIYIDSTNLNVGEITCSIDEFREELINYAVKIKANKDAHESNLAYIESLEETPIIMARATTYYKILSKVDNSGDFTISASVGYYFDTTQNYYLLSGSATSITAKSLYPSNTTFTAIGTSSRLADGGRSLFVYLTGTQYIYLSGIPTAFPNVTIYTEFTYNSVN